MKVTRYIAGFSKQSGAGLPPPLNIAKRLRLSMPCPERELQRIGQRGGAGFEITTAGKNRSRRADAICARLVPLYKDSGVV